MHKRGVKKKRHPGDTIEDDIKQDGDQTQKQSQMLQVWANQKLTQSSLKSGKIISRKLNQKQRQKSFFFQKIQENQTKTRTNKESKRLRVKQQFFFSLLQCGKGDSTMFLLSFDNCSFCPTATVTHTNIVSNLRLNSGLIKEAFHDFKVYRDNRNS